jgi:hypothetical protein
MTRRLFVPLLVIAALGVGSCGGSHEADRQDVVKAVKGFYNALADKNAKKACAEISEKGRKEIEEATARSGSKKQTCEGVVSIALAFGSGALEQAKDVDVTDVKIDGDQAKATVSLQKRKTQVGLVKEDGDWKLGGASLTGG